MTLTLIYESGYDLFIVSQNQSYYYTRSSLQKKQVHFQYQFEHRQAAVFLYYTFILHVHRKHIMEQL